MKTLDRTIGLGSVIAISLSAMLGSGIFVLPGLAAEKTGPSIAFAYLLAGICVLPAALCKGELATAMPSSGGTYVYLFRAFGPLAGTVAGLGLWMSLLLKSSFALVGFSAYLETLAPGLPIVPTGLALLVAVTLLNVGGIGKLSKVQIVVATVSVVGLAVLMVAGIPAYETRHFDPLFPDGAGGLFGAAAFVFVSYAGVTKIAALAGEVKEPHKNLPRGIVLTLIIAAALYGVVTFVLVAVVPPEALRGNLRPIHTLAEAIGGRPLGVAAAVLSVVTMTSMAAAGLLAASRFPYAMARDDLVPRPLRHVSDKTGSPVVAILATASMMGVAIVSLDVMKIAKLASAFTILMYMAVNLAVIVLREGRVSWYAPTYHAPLYPALQILGLLSGLVLVVLLGLLPATGAFVLSLVGAALYFGYSRKRTAQRGVVGKMGRRDDLVPSTQGHPAQAHPAQAHPAQGHPAQGHPVRGQAAEDAPLVTEAEVVVALFGEERSPEMLVDVAAALSDGKLVHAMHLTEIGEVLEVEGAIERADARVASLERRITALAEETQTDARFDAVASRDIVRSVHGITAREGCEWLVMQWHGRPRRSLTSLTPIGWLVNHIPANLAMFRDAGVRYVRKILVLPAPGPHDDLVVGTADHLATRWKAELTLARFVPADAAAATVEAEREYLAQLAGLCEVPTSSEILRGRSKTKAVVAFSAGYDLLVMASPQLSLRNLFRRSDEDRITAQAPCSVLRLRTPRGGTHVAFSRRTERSDRPKRRLIDFLDPDAVAARLEVGSKGAVMAQLGSRLAPLVDGASAKAIQEALLAREREQNTGVGHGVALPHGTVDKVSRPVVGVFTTREPVDYEALDDAPVDVFFVSLCPPSEREIHLRILSDIARLTLKTDVLERLRRAEGAETMIQALEDCSRELETASS